MSDKDIWTTDEGRQMCRHGGLSHSLNTSCPDEGDGLICDRCGKAVDTHPTVDVSHTDRLALCQDRAIKWQRVEPGTPVEAGRTYRVEYPSPLDGWKKAVESQAPPEGYTIPTHGAWLNYEWFVDSSWKPPLVLPTTPTWGIAVGKWNTRIGHWFVEGSLLRDKRGGWVSADYVLDFIPLTDEQVARIEAAR